jgi:hypothetical protein
MARKKEWAHLVKPLVIKEGPAKLYPEPRIWAEGKDWEGYNGNFSFGFFTEPGVCHPIEGAVVHPYDECLIFAGTDTSDILNLDGEISIELGEEREEHIFNVPSVVSIPKGLSHGAVRVRKINRKPIAHYLFGLSSEYKAETISEKSRPRKTTGQKYAHLIKPLKTYLSNEMRRAMAHTATDAGYKARMEAFAATSKTGMGYEALADATGVLRPRNVMGPGNADQLVWLFGEDIQNFELNFTWGFFSGTGKWHRPGEGHTHPEVESLIFVGLNPYDLNYLGAEFEIAMGPEFERHVFNKPTAVICPAGFVHLPLITRWCDDTYAFIVGCLGGVHEAPWVNPEDLE